MPDLMTRLQAADPAAEAALPRGTRAAVRERVTTASTRDAARAAARAGRRPLARRVLRSRRTPLFAALLALALAGGAVATFDFGQTPAQVERDYARVIRTVPLPPGHTWPGAMVDKDAVYAGRRAAIVTATGQASCAWWGYWMSAAERGDRATMARALAGQERVFAMTPRHPRGASEDVGGIDATTVAATTRLIADARAGRTAPVRAYLRANC